MSVINTNVKSLVAQNAMSINNRSLDKAMQQLSTGKRINSAQDDAAGLAISNKVTAQIRGLKSPTCCNACVNWPCKPPTALTNRQTALH